MASHLPSASSSAVRMALLSSAPSSLHASSSVHSSASRVQLHEALRLNREAQAELKAHMAGLREAQKQLELHLVMSVELSLPPTQDSSVRNPTNIPYTSTDMNKFLRSQFGRPAGGPFLVGYDRTTPEMNPHAAERQKEQTLYPTEESHIRWSEADDACLAQAVCRAVKVSKLAGALAQVGLQFPEEALPLGDKSPLLLERPGLRTELQYSKRGLQFEDLPQRSLEGLSSSQKQQLQLAFAAIHRLSDKELLQGMSEDGGEVDWARVAFGGFLPPSIHPSPSDCRMRWRRALGGQPLNKGSWTAAEDKQLLQAIKVCRKEGVVAAAAGKGAEAAKGQGKGGGGAGAGGGIASFSSSAASSSSSSLAEESLEAQVNWQAVASSMTTGRSASQCLSRFLQKHHKQASQLPWTEEESTQLLRLVQEHGTEDWATIAALMPGRNKTSIAAHWNTVLRPDLIPFDSTAYGLSEEAKTSLLLQCYGGNITEAVRHLPHRLRDKMRDKLGQKMKVLQREQQRMKQDAKAKVKVKAQREEEEEEEEEEEKEKEEEEQQGQGHAVSAEGTAASSNAGGGDDDAQFIAEVTAPALGTGLKKRRGGSGGAIASSSSLASAAALPLSADILDQNLLSLLQEQEEAEALERERPLRTQSLSLARRGAGGAGGAAGGEEADQSPTAAAGGAGSAFGKKRSRRAASAAADFDLDAAAGGVADDASGPAAGSWKL